MQDQKVTVLRYRQQLVFLYLKLETKKTFLKGVIFQTNLENNGVRVNSRLKSAD